MKVMLKLAPDSPEYRERKASKMEMPERKIITCKRFEIRDNVLFLIDTASGRKQRRDEAYPLIWIERWTSYT